MDVPHAPLLSGLAPLREEISQPGVGYAVNRGEKIAKEHKYQLP